jgi:hypothetical protein
MIAPRGQVVGRRTVKIEHPLRGGFLMTENMEADAVNMSMRRFLKQVGITSQRELERLVEQNGMRGKGKLTVRAVITAEGTDLNHVVEGEIDLG